jgi:nucleoside-diphosphate-sugar epimerase
VQGLLLGNGVANVEAAKAAKKTGAKKFVYVSVASEVADSRGWLPAFFKGYFDGKNQAEAAILEEFGESGTTIVKPTFIYGGDSFGLFPPRVNAAYGSGVEELLSSDLIQKLANALPGLIKVALRPPVSVDAVAGACSAAVLGNAVGVLDGTAQINSAAGQPAATGLTDFINSVKEKFAELTAEK